MSSEEGNTGEEIPSSALLQAADLLGVPVRRLQAALMTLQPVQAPAVATYTPDQLPSYLDLENDLSRARPQYTAGGGHPKPEAQEAAIDGHTAAVVEVESLRECVSGFLRTQELTRPLSDHLVDNYRGFLSSLNSGSSQRSFHPASGHILNNVENFSRIFDYEPLQEPFWPTADILSSDTISNGTLSADVAASHIFSEDLDRSNTLLDAAQSSHKSIPLVGWEGLNTSYPEQPVTGILQEFLGPELNIQQASVYSPQSQVQPWHKVHPRFPGSQGDIPRGLGEGPSTNDSDLRKSTWQEAAGVPEQFLSYELPPNFGGSQQNQFYPAENQRLPPHAFQSDISHLGAEEYYSLGGVSSLDDFQPNRCGPTGSQYQLPSGSQPNYSDSGAGTYFVSPVLPTYSPLDFQCNSVYDPAVLNIHWPQSTEQDMALFDEILNCINSEAEPDSAAGPPESFDEPRQPDQSCTIQVSRPGPQRVPKENSKRKSYLDHELKQTNLTRHLRGCIRCRMNRKRCIPDPTNPAGPCLTCQKTIFNVFNLPCLRYKITDSILHRNSTDSHFNQQHPMIGTRYGDFYIPKNWCDSVIKTFEITQDRGIVLRLKVRQFDLPDEEGAIDTKGLAGQGRHMYAIPWAIVDAESGLDSINTYIDASVEKYIDAVVDPSKAIVLKVFHRALNLASLPEPVQILRNVLRLWTATRFIEGGWRCCGEDKLGADKLRNPLRPSWWVSLPPYVDYQFASIIMHRVLAPLRKKVLKQLEDLVTANKPSNWFHIFLTTFILLFNYELNTAFEVKFSVKRKLAVRYSDMSTINATQSGSKTLLAHFHYVCKGNVPFQPGFDWASKSTQTMAQLDSDQMAFIQSFLQELENKAAEFSNVSEDIYDDDYWFTSQLFKPAWIPRDTHEYSPPLVV